MLATIQAYEVQVSKNPAAFFPPCCPVCSKAGVLRKHELRRRTFWTVAFQEVKRVASCVLRVACGVCDTRTTVLPDFAFPHKRYVLPQVINASDRYLLDETATYESCARVDDRPVFHDTDGCSRARSTVHRWIGYLGSLAILLGLATDLVREVDSACSPLAELCSIASHRARSEARRELLVRAYRLLRVRVRFQRSTQRDLFPRVATPACWR